MSRAVHSDQEGLRAMTGDPPTPTGRFDEALQYAVQLHRHQRRKGSGVSYVGHLLAVAAIVIDDGGSEDEIIAALLHDGPEDAGGLETLSEIERRFGESVRAIVAGCSDTFESKKPPWCERKQAYIEHLKTATPSVLRVSCADKLANVRSQIHDYRQVQGRLWERFSEGREGQLWYYRTLADCFQRRLPGALADDLHDALVEFEELIARTEAGAHV